MAVISITRRHRDGTPEILCAPFEASGSPELWSIRRRNRRPLLGILLRQRHPWDVPRGCVTACKLFGYQLRAPRRLVLQVVNELRLAAVSRAEFRNRFWFTFRSSARRDRSRTRRLATKRGSEIIRIKHVSWIRVRARDPCKFFLARHRAGAKIHRICPMRPRSSARFCPRDNGMLSDPTDAILRGNPRNVRQESSRARRT